MAGAAPHSHGVKAASIRFGHSAFHAAISRVSKRQELMVDLSWLDGARLSSSIKTFIPTLSAKHHINPAESSAWAKIVRGAGVGVAVAAGTEGSVSSVGSSAPCSSVRQGSRSVISSSVGARWTNWNKACISILPVRHDSTLGELRARDIIA